MTVVLKKKTSSGRGKQTTTETSDISPAVKVINRVEDKCTLEQIFNKTLQTMTKRTQFPDVATVDRGAAASLRTRTEVLNTGNPEHGLQEHSSLEL